MNEVKEYKRSLLRKIKNECNYELKEFNDLLNINNLKKYLVIYVGSEIKVMEEIL